MVKTERANCPSEFVWNITDFSEILRQAKAEEKEMIKCPILHRPPWLQVKSKGIS